MSVILQFNCLTQNETARKAMESYVEILQKAFEHYQNLWEDYIQLQEKYKQCNALHSSSQVTIDTKIKNEAISQQSQQSNNADGQENSSTPSCIPLLRLVTNSNDFNPDTEPSLSDTTEFLHKDTNENNRPESPIFSKMYPKTGAKSAKKLRLSKILCSDSTSDMKTHHGEKVSSKYNHKLEISTTRHVETTFLPDGKRLKQSRLAFHPVKSKENTVLASSVDKCKPASRLYIEQNFTEKISTENTSIFSTASTEKDATNNSTEISEDVIEVSPQRNITSKVKRRLKLKRKNPARCIIKNSPNKNKYFNHRPGLSVVPEIINVDLCPSPKYTSTQIDDDKSLTNTTVNTLKDKVSTNYLSPIKMDNKTNVQIKKSIEAQKEDLLLIQNFNNIKDLAYEDEFFDLPIATKKNDMDNLKDETRSEDSENKPPEKKMLLNKFNVFPKRKADVSKQLNMRCKADREKLNGLDCWECRKYYQNLSLSKEELKKRLNQCSRHRHNYERPNTPEGFWDPEFPETLSCTYQQEN
ncbi:PREDICTED: DNA endonuclease RBBP8-like [Acromyrmex echinatior]|uniref:Retinoblastoma-binding protein 8 n=1 Tax=Acromyrmex echinatior TaxID=103372 RepID=F4WZT3_ACREC|nr:PREDICTED: DNA endonuclease RBBP8-like [Acromyrmex echinatior]EGI60358.1 Retinoblastoma-binding protein 8 [Acromyrmex echinatior]